MKDSQFDLTAEKQIDVLCNEFEEDWIAEKLPDIQKYLERIQLQSQSSLLRDLLRIECDYRSRRGETPSLEEYNSRFPGCTSIIVEVLRERGSGDSSFSEPMDGVQRDFHDDKTATVSYRPVLPVSQPGRYIRTRFHKGGGMGDVWYCQDTDINREVAYKRMKKQDEKHRNRFFAEAQITGQLEHPGIVPVYDLGIDEENQPFYVMKFERGQTLKKIIADFHSNKGKSDRVQRLRLLEIFVDVCQAVAYAHSKGVLHRDLKPDNIMLGEFGEAVVLDWGLAKVMGQSESPSMDSQPSYVRLTHTSDGASETQEGDVMGAPPYMAPEVAESRWEDVSETTDIYLLGATLYQILTGQPPRRGSSFDEMRTLAATVAPPPPREINSEIPRPLEKICLKAMAFEKDDRYSSALELANDIEHFLAGETVSVYQETLVERGWRWCKDHRKGVTRTAATIFILGVVLLSIGTVTHYRRNAVRLELEIKANSDIERFRRKSDETLFWAAAMEPASEKAPYFDYELARSEGDLALAALSDWAPDLANLPTQSDAKAIRQEVSDFLLLMVQLRLRTSTGSEFDQETLLMLKRAAALADRSQSFYRLRAELMDRLGDSEAAQSATQNSKDMATPQTAIDYFLAGEQFRTGTVRPARENVVEQLEDLEHKGKEPATLNETPFERNHEQLDTAIAQFRKALELNPDHYWARFQLARCSIAIGDDPEAINLLSQCIGQRPDSPWGYNGRAWALALVGRFDEAENDLTRVLQMEPGFVPAMLNMGVVMLLKGPQSYNQALAAFNKVLSLPEDQCLQEARLYRGQIFLAAQSYEKALADFDAFIEYRSLPSAHLLRAKTHLQIGQKQNIKLAIDDLDTFLGTNPAQPEWLQSYNRGVLLRRIAGELTPKQKVATLVAARQELEKAKASGGNTAALHEEYGRILDLLALSTGSAPLLTAAIAAYTDSLQLARDSIPVLSLRARALQKIKKNDAADVDFNAILLIKPNGLQEMRLVIDAHAGLAYSLAVRGQEEQAHDAATQAAHSLDAIGDDWLVRHNIACVYGALSEPDLDSELDNEFENALYNQKLAIAQLQLAASLAKTNGRAAEELKYLRSEVAFPPALRANKHFQAIQTGLGQALAQPVTPAVLP